jgi:hypothetical protein
MVIVMNLQRRTCWLASLLISTLLPGGVRAASLAEVKSVYLFPMAHGMDQYLAERLTRDHVLQVVTDPRVADAVITDRLGVGFETALLKARPELKPVPPAKPKKDDADKDSDKDKDNKEEEIVPVSAFHSGHGTVFLVHAKTRNVVWSTYMKPTRTDAREMERTAARIAKLLEKDIAPAPATPVKK